MKVGIPTEAEFIRLFEGVTPKDLKVKGEPHPLEDGTEGKVFPISLTGIAPEKLAGLRKSKVLYLYPKMYLFFFGRAVVVGRCLA